MGPLALFLLVLLGAALPDLLPAALGLERHPPNVFVFAALYMALRARGYNAVGWALVLGLLQDCISLEPLGSQGFVLGITAFIFSEGTRSRGRIDGVARALYIFVGTLVATVVMLIRTLPYGGPDDRLAALWGAVPAALFTALLALPLGALLDRTRALDDLLGRGRALST